MPFSNLSSSSVGFIGNIFFYLLQSVIGKKFVIRGVICVTKLCSPMSKLAKLKPDNAGTKSSPCELSHRNETMQQRTEDVGQGGGRGVVMHLVWFGPTLNRGRSCKVYGHLWTFLVARFQMNQMLFAFFKFALKKIPRTRRN